MTVAARVARTGGRRTCLLGEGPVWDPALRRARAGWTSSAGSCTAGARVRRTLPSTWASRWAARCRARPAGSRWRCGTASRCCRRRRPAASSWRRSSSERSDTRMNDGACDSRGRFWAGTMSLAGDTRAAALYRLDPDLTRHARASRAVDLERDGLESRRPRHVPRRHAAAADRRLRLRRRCRHDRRAPGRDRRSRPDAGRPGRPGRGRRGRHLGGALGRRRRAALHARTVGRTRAIELPVSQVTSCCFGDPDLGTLYVTTAARGAEHEPLAGSRVRLPPGRARASRDAVRGLEVAALEGRRVLVTGAGRRDRPGDRRRAGAPGRGRLRPHLGHAAGRDARPDRAAAAPSRSGETSRSVGDCARVVDEAAAALGGGSTGS